MTDAVADLTQLTYRYPGAGREALRGVDLRLDGGLVAVAGPSGGGKSTLLRVFNGLVPHFHGGVIAGRATVWGLDVLREPTRRLAARVGFVFQDPELQAVYATVERDVAFGLENLRVPAPLMRGRVERALEQTGLTALRSRSVATLSGGERQRLALAGVLAMEPGLLVLDEPLSQLDGPGAAGLMAIVAGLAADGSTVIVAEHRLEHVLPRATRALTVEAGALRDGIAPPPSPHPRAAAGGAPPGPTDWELRAVAAGHGRTAVIDGVELTGGGDVVALVGANGSGKTTLLRTIAGLQRPLAGTVLRRPGRVAYLPQNPAAMLHRASVRAELEWTLRAGGGAGSSRASDSGGEVARMLRAFGLAEKTLADPRELSSGERQRAALACVLVGDPMLALLDEPTRGMDTAARSALVAELRRLVERGGSAVIATHDERLVAEVATRVVRLAEGAARELPEREAVLA